MLNRANRLLSRTLDLIDIDVNTTHIDPTPTPWTSRLLYLVSGWLLFEAASGLAILFLPFGLTKQVLILIHTAIGWVLLIPVLWYLIRHWTSYRHRPANEHTLTGYTAALSTLLAILTGILLTWEAATGPAITPLWKYLHIATTVTLVASAFPHVLRILSRDLRLRSRVQAMIHRQHDQKRFGVNSLFLLLVQLLVTLLIMILLVNRPLNYPVPENYLYHPNSDSPFYPSLATTESGELIPPELLGGSESCGTSGCHSEIYEEWENSAHRYSASDPFFRRIQENMGELKGPVSARYCAGCHDPIGLFGGSANLYADSLTFRSGIEEGISCISCHAMNRADVRGNADYTLKLPDFYLFEHNRTAAGKWLSDFLIRSAPKAHAVGYNPPLLRTSEHCGACHKQYIDEDINSVGWVQLQNQYDQWKESHWITDGDPMGTLECRECHMPLSESTDPAAGDPHDFNRSSNDSKHRGHRFLGGNQFVPKLLDLPNAEEHVRQIEEWLRGEYEIPEIADRWVQGPAIHLTVVAPDTILAGESFRIDLFINNRKAGHDFPTGPLDMMQAWIELQVLDPYGELIFSSGTLDENHFIEPGAFIYRAEPIDQYGNLIDRHNLWEMVGVRSSRALFPGKTDFTRFQISTDSLQRSEYQVTNSDAPATWTLNGAPLQTSELVIQAKLHYRKINQFLMNTVFDDLDGADTAPITTIAEQEHRITILPIQSHRP